VPQFAGYKHSHGAAVVVVVVVGPQASVSRDHAADAADQVHLQSPSHGEYGDAVVVVVVVVAVAVS